MKKPVSKALSKLAEILPPAYVYRKHTEYGPLWQIYQKTVDQGMNVEGLPFLTDENRDKIYPITYTALEVLNHHKRLKKAYTEKGETGIKEYIKWLYDYNKIFQAEHSQKIEQVPEGLYEITKAGAGKFWQLLLNFIFSFVTFFKSDETSVEN